MFRLEVEENYSRKTQEFLNKLAYDSTVLTHINNIIGTNLNQFVPMQSGALRGSMYADAEGVHWNTPYAHYQYEGEVYRPQKAIYYRGRIIGWNTPAGTEKYPTGDELGLPGYLNGWTFGYTTPGTQHHWDEAYTGNQWEQGSGGLKSKINAEITRYVKSVANVFWALGRS